MPRMDFVQDLHCYATRLLDGSPYPLQGRTPGDPLLDAYHLYLKVPTTKPRVVIEHPMLVLPAEHRMGYSMFKLESQRGAELWRRLSRRCYDLSVPGHDGLFNDWGFTHFHLGVLRLKNGLMKRTGALVLGLVTNDTIYVLEVSEAHLATNEWANTDRFLDKMHQWRPDVISSHRLDCTADPLDAASKITLRQKGLTTLTVVNDGTVYAPIKGNVMSGHLLGARQLADETHVRTAKIEERVRTMFPRLQLEFASKGVVVPDDSTWVWDPVNWVAQCRTVPAQITVQRS